ncbi:MAG: hypothetical protein KAR20_00075, partial [Candidatus Heimdallarchaeota archaeon]|nr:hypothetical protein [Candidatus Heimdallarchaeota archaeon]
ARYGYFRRIEREMVKMDIFSPRQETVKIKLPFDIQNMVKIRHGEVIIIAGAKDSGKTAFALNIAIENVNNFDVHYFNSEMGDDELADRCELFDHIDFNEWKKIAFWPRTENFHDVIVPGKNTLNIIDFMEVYEEFYIIKKWIAKVWEKLNGAIAVINIQKPTGRDYGWGGEGTIEKARLALSLDRGTVKIVSGKNWIGKNPRGKKINFKIVGGNKFFQSDEWTLDD